MIQTQELAFDDDRRRDDERMNEVVRNSRSGPDLTDPIMRRLGFARAGRRSVVLAGLRKRSTQLLVCLLFLASLCVGWTIRKASEVVRRPAANNLPSLVSNDVQSTFESFEATLRTVRQVTDVIPTASGHEPAEIATEPPAER